MMRAVNLFAGVGSTTRAFLEQGIPIVWAQEENRDAAMVFEQNFPEIEIFSGKLSEIIEPKAPEFEILISEVRAPALAVVGKGMQGEFRHLEELDTFIEKTMPPVLFLSLSAAADKARWFHGWIEGLESKGYHLKWARLKASEYGGVPFAGRRVYLIGFKNESFFDAFHFPGPLERDDSLSDFIHIEQSMPAYYYCLPKNVNLEAAGQIADRDAVYQFKRIPAGSSYLYQNSGKSEDRQPEKTQSKAVFRKNNLCPVLNRMVWSNTFILDHHGPRRLSWREYLEIQRIGEMTFPDRMSESAIWNCMSFLGLYTVEQRVAEQVVKALGYEREPLQAKLAETFIGGLPDLFDLPWNKKLGLLSMPFGTGVSSTVSYLAQRLLEKTRMKWKIVILGDTGQSCEHLESLLLQNGTPNMAAEQKDDIEIFMQGRIPVLVTPLATWRQYIRAGMARGNHNNLILVALSAERSWELAEETKASLLQAYYIGVTPLAAEKVSGRVRGSFGEVRCQYTYEQAVTDGYLTPVYRELLSVGQAADQADADEKIAWELLADFLKHPEEKKAVITVRCIEEANRIYDYLVKMIDFSKREAEKTAQNWEMDLLALKQALSELECGLLTTGMALFHREEALKRFRQSRKGLLVLVSLWTGMNEPEISSVYLIGRRNLFELSGLLSLVSGKGNEKRYGRMVATDKETFEGLDELTEGGITERSAFIDEVFRGNYGSARKRLDKMEKQPGISGRIIREEFSFLFPPGRTGKQLETFWKRNESQLKELCSIWRLTAAYSNDEIKKIFFDREEEKREEAEETAAFEPPRREAAGPADGGLNERAFSSSAEKGRFLENAVMELLRNLFSLDGEMDEKLEGNVREVLDYLRRQNSGNQDGYDIRLAYLDETGTRRTCLFECKYVLKKKILFRDVLGKLEQVRLAEKSEIDHWILVAPLAKLDSDAAQFFERQKEYPGSYLPIKDIQVWDEENGVKELFGLAPEIYGAIYGESPVKGADDCEEAVGREDAAPRQWSAEKRRRILAAWKKKLKPALLLPAALIRYPEQPEKLFFDLQNDAELRRQYEHQYRRYIKLFFFTENGTRSERPLEERVIEWLYQEQEQVKVILGEFGDGKTFFLYCLCRRLCVEFRENPEKRYLPICCSLKKLREKGSVEALIEGRMRELGCTLSDFIGLKERFHVLFCLDGLDEMSSGVGYGSLIENAKLLSECCRYLKGVKILFTSRLQSFLSNEIKEMLYERLGGFEVLKLAPIQEEDVITALTGAGGGIESNAGFTWTEPRLKLAGKPLFLGMVQELLESDEAIGDSEAEIYDTYIGYCLKRKFADFYEHEDVLVRETETIKRIYMALEEIAFALQLRQEETLRIDEVSELLGKGMAEVLWKKKDADRLEEEDAGNRFSMRSLLKYEGDGKISFAHRSIKEYFVGRHLLRMLDENTGQFRTVFLSGSFNYEVLRFFAECINEEPGLSEKRKQVLLGCLRICGESGTASEGGGRVCAAAKILQVFYFINRKIPEAEWSKQCLDGVYIPDADLSGLNLSGSLIRNANLNNVCLDRSDCSRCDLSGTKLEETSQVKAVKAVGRKLRVIYEDGCVRDWDLHTGEEKTAGEIRPFSEHCIFRTLDCIFGISGRMAALEPVGSVPEALMAYRIRRDTRILSLENGYLLINEKSGGGWTLYLIDLKRFKCIRKWENCGEARGKMTDSHSLAVFLQGKLELLLHLDEGKGESDAVIQLNTESVLDFDVMEVNGEYRAAACTREKLILAALKLGFDGGGKQREWQIPVYGAAPLALCGEKFLAAGGTDGTVRLFAVDWEKRRVDWEAFRELKLGIYCKEIKTDGLIPEEVRRRLEEHR